MYCTYDRSTIGLCHISELFCFYFFVHHVAVFLSVHNNALDLRSAPHREKKTHFPIPNSTCFYFSCHCSLFIKYPQNIHTRFSFSFLFLYMPAQDCITPHI